MPFPPLNFCSKCGAKLVLRVPPGDSLPRHVCDDCGTIHYRNPLVVVGTIPAWKDQVLLCKRAIEPRYGLWTLPSGFMELGETTAQGALRETMEEARANIEGVVDANATTNGSAAAKGRRASETEPAGAVVLEVDNLSRSFGGIQAVDSVSLTLHAGEILPPK